MRLHGYYWLSLGFNSSKNLNCIGALFKDLFSFFLDLVNEKSIWSTDFNHAGVIRGVKIE